MFDSNTSSCISLFLQRVNLLLQDLATILKFLQDPFMFSEASVVHFEPDYDDAKLDSKPYHAP